MVVELGDMRSRQTAANLEKETAKTQVAGDYLAFLRGSGKNIFQQHQRCQCAIAVDG